MTPSANFQAAIEQPRPGAAVLRLSGEIDMAAAERLAEELARAEAGASELLIIDLSGVSFFDSTAIRAILGARERTRARGVRLVVAGGTQARHTLEIAGLLSRIDIVPDVATALGAGLLDGTV